MAVGTLATNVFAESLRKSGLFSDQEYHDLLHLARSAGLHPDDSKGMAIWCVQQGYLTKFQAKQLNAGKWRNFIINHKYKVLDPLGQGGMGAVFRCEHLSLKKEVALKVLPTELTKEPAALQRFLREARALASLDHPNIVQAHDVDENRGQYFIVMACVEGRTLLDLVRGDGPLSVGQAADYIAQACRGLQHAQEAGWVHRDLKPGNLILDQSGTVKIADFGLARLSSTTDGSVTRQFNDCNVLGSPDYISPEQAMNLPEVDVRADIYSLGATLYFLLSGRGPFEGEPLLQKLLAHQMREPEDVSFFRGDVPEGMVRVLKKMMAKNPADRYALPRDVEQELLPFVRTQADKAPSTTNRVRRARTVRVPRVDTAKMPLAPTDPLGMPALDPVADFSPETDPEFFQEGEAADGISPDTSRVLKIGAAAALALGAILFLLWWLFSPGDLNARLAQADKLNRQRQWKATAALLADLLRETPEGSKERKEVYSRVSWGPVAAQLVEDFPTDTVLNRKAVSYFVSEKQHDKAITCLETVLAADAKDAELWRQLASVAVLLRQWPKAANALEKAYALKQDNAEWCRDRAFVYVAMGDQENYRRVCREALERFGQPEKPWGNRIEVAYLFGQGDNPPELQEKMLQMSKAMAQEHPNETNHLYRYGVALYRAGKLREAYDTLKYAQGDENRPGYLPRRAEPVLAMILFRQGKQDEARSLLADHRKWYNAELAKKPKSPFTPVFDRWWDSLALENLLREAETVLEGKARL